MSKTLTEQCQDIARKYTFHKVGCSFYCACESDPESDFCNCNITDRRTDLVIDIENLVRNQNVA
jgi:hypothetical protein